MIRQKLKFLYPVPYIAQILIVLLSDGSWIQKCILIPILAFGGYIGIVKCGMLHDKNAEAVRDFHFRFITIAIAISTVLHLFLPNF